MHSYATVKKKMIPSGSQKRQVLGDRYKINRNVRAALTSISEGDFEGIEGNLLIIQKHFQDIEDYLSTTIEPIYCNKWRKVGSTIAEKVFAVPELLESIFLGLRTTDIISCYGVNRTFRDTIEQSRKLQTSLFLRAAAGTSSERQACPVPRSNILQTSGGKDFYASIKRPNNPDDALPNIGSRWKSMFVTQPPLRKISYCIGSQDGWRYCIVKASLHKQEQMEREDGVTIGDILEKAEAFLRLHRGCNGCNVVRFHG